MVQHTQCVTRQYNQTWFNTDVVSRAMLPKVAEHTRCGSLFALLIHSTVICLHMSCLTSSDTSFAYLVCFIFLPAYTLLALYLPILCHLPACFHTSCLTSSTTFSLLYFSSLPTNTLLVLPPYTFSWLTSSTTLFLFPHTSHFLSCIHISCANCLQSDV